jgi:chromosome partitioning protein
MRQILVVNPKGGCGKTTVATTLAGYYAGRGLSVTLVDCDPQKSAADWHCARPKSAAPIQLICSAPDTPVNYEIATDITIHDLPAGWIPQLSSPCLASEQPLKMLIPMLPSPTDIKAGLRFMMALYRAGVLEQKISAALVANRTRSQLRVHQLLLGFLQRIDLPLLSSLRDSQNYIRSIEHGISLFDLPASAVQQDLAQWQPIIDWLETGAVPIP